MPMSQAMCRTSSLSGHAEAAETARDDAAGMIRGEEERRLPLQPRDDDRVRLVGSEQFRRAVVHEGSALGAQ